MRVMFRVAVCSATLVTLALPASAADVAFAGPAGWSRAAAVSPGDAMHQFDQWHIAGDAATTVTFIKDGTTAYADALGRIEKNFADNKIKPATDKDFTCQGKTGHVIEFSTGPDGHKIVINRLLVPDGAGVDTVTYSRADGSAFDPDVQKAETAYCAAS